MIDGLIMVLVGGYFWLVANEKIPLNKDPAKNATALEKFGPIGRTLTPIVVIVGFIFILMDLL